MMLARGEVNKIAVTGAAGFIGRHLVRALSLAGCEVKALARDVTQLAALPGVERIACDVTHPDALRKALSDVDVVVHAAARVGGITAGEQAMHAANVIGTRNVVLASRRNNVRKLIYISTVAVTGSVNRAGPVKERDEPHPRSIYGRTKLLGENEVLEPEGDFTRLIVRPMWVYGADSPSMQKLIRNIVKGRMVLIGAADNFIQPLYIDDLTDALLRCVSAAGLRQETLQLAGPAPFTTNELCQKIAKATNARTPKLHFPLWTAQIAATALERLFQGTGRKLPIDSDKVDFFRVHHHYSLDRAASVIGWQPRINFDEGLRRTLDGLVLSST